MNVRNGPIAALKRWAYTDGRVRHRARSAGLTSDLNVSLNPEGVLDPQRRAERVKRARRRIFLELARRFRLEVRRARKSSGCALRWARTAIRTATGHGADRNHWPGA